MLLGGENGVEPIGISCSWFKWSGGGKGIIQGASIRMRGGVGAMALGGINGGIFFVLGIDRMNKVWGMNGS